MTVLPKCIGTQLRDYSLFLEVIAQILFINLETRTDLLNCRAENDAFAFYDWPQFLPHCFWLL